MKRAFAIALLLLLLTNGSGIAQQVDLQVSTDGQYLGIAKTLFSDSNVLWQRKLTGICSPVATKDQVFALEVVGTKSPKCHLYCFDSIGKKKWKKPAWTPPKYHLHSIRLISDGTAQVGVVHNEGIQIRGFDGKKPQQQKSMSKLNWRATGLTALKQTKDVSLEQAFFYQQTSTPNQYPSPDPTSITPAAACTVRQYYAFYRKRPKQLRILTLGSDLKPGFYEGMGSFSSPPDGTPEQASEMTMSDLDFSFRLLNNQVGTATPTPFPLMIIRLGDVEGGTAIDGSLPDGWIPIAHGFFLWDGILSSIGRWPNDRRYPDLFSISNEAGQVVDNKLVLISNDRLSLIVLKLGAIDFENANFNPAGFVVLENRIQVHWLHRQDLGISSLLQHRQYIYLVNADGTLVCLDANTKKECYREELLFANKTVSTPVAHEDTVYIACRDGSITSFKAGPEFKDKSVANFNEEVVGPPVFAGRQAYLQTTKNLYSFSLNPDKTTVPRNHYADEVED